jgi:ABC-type antimicrobial peptide transport system permease subunit
MALGAARSEVLRLIMKEVAVLAVFGIAVALPAAFVLSRLIETQWYNVKASDPVVFGGATLLLACVAALAGFIPAFKATSIDPMIALRNE